MFGGRRSKVDPAYMVVMVEDARRERTNEWQSQQLFVANTITCGSPIDQFHKLPEMPKRLLAPAKHHVSSRQTHVTGNSPKTRRRCAHSSKFTHNLLQARKVITKLYANGRSNHKLELNASAVVSYLHFVRLYLRRQGEMRTLGLNHHAPLAAVAEKGQKWIVPLMYPMIRNLGV